MNLFCSVSDTRLTLWWDQPEQVTANATYTVLLDGKTGRQTDRTHCTLEGLTPERCYQVCVKMDQVCIGEGIITMGKTPRRLDVRDFGAVGDGKTLNTAALQSALDHCGKDEEVWFPAGVYLTGALRLHSDMKVYLDREAVLMGTDNPEDYLPKIWSRFEGVEQECYQSLLNLGTLDHTAGPNCRNVWIYGEGRICGGGQTLARRTIETERERLKEVLAALGDRIKECENDDTIPGRARGRLINLSNCENIRISGLTLENGASWNVHMIYSRNIITDHCIFRSEEVWNGDGWDPDSSEKCTLFACEFHTGDDAVAIKSGKNPEGNAINRPTRSIRIFDCKSEYGLGIAIGSEMSGGVEDVHIWDCDLEHSLYGVQIKGTKKRGGYVKNVTIRHSRLSRFLCCAVLYNDDGEGSPVPPVFSDMVLERVHLTGWARNYWEPELHAMPGIDLTGFDVPGHETCNIRFEDCTLGKEATIALSHCRQIHLDIRQTE
ncbi:MAG: glycoside hydrolase family 28 protein [Clostridia bacterium]|nr:glycoside hydrolase family 28 protein [Clostridia bacterium]